MEISRITVRFPVVGNQLPIKYLTRKLQLGPEAVEPRQRVQEEERSQTPLQYG